MDSKNTCKIIGELVIHIDSKEIMKENDSQLRILYPVHVNQGGS